MKSSSMATAWPVASMAALADLLFSRALPTLPAPS
jgi:hypothetical protein